MVEVEGVEEVDDAEEVNGIARADGAESGLDLLGTGGGGGGCWSNDAGARAARGLSFLSTARRWS